MIHDTQYVFMIFKIGDKELELGLGFRLVCFFNMDVYGDVVLLKTMLSWNCCKLIRSNLI